MKTKPLAFSVHLLTGSGAALALMALVAATQADWRLMFGWLGLALIVDGIDGPLARKADTKKNAANWDGVILDLVIDYLTYVFIPAYALIYADAAALALGPDRGAVDRADRRGLLRRRADEGRGQLLRRLPGGLADAAAGVPGLHPPVWATLGIILVLGARAVHLAEVHPSGAHRALAARQPAGVPALGGAGGLVDLGELRPAAAGEAGAARRQPVAAVRRHRDAGPAAQARAKAVAESGPKPSGMSAASARFDAAKRARIAA